MGNNKNVSAKVTRSQEIYLCFPYIFCVCIYVCTCGCAFAIWTCIRDWRRTFGSPSPLLLPQILGLRCGSAGLPGKGPWSPLLVPSFSAFHSEHRMLYGEDSSLSLLHWEWSGDCCHGTAGPVSTFGCLRASVCVFSQRIIVNRQERCTLRCAQTECMRVDQDGLSLTAIKDVSHPHSRPDTLLSLTFLFS